MRMTNLLTTATNRGRWRRLATMVALVSLALVPALEAKKKKKEKPGMIVGKIVNKAGEALPDVQVTVTSEEHPDLLLEDLSDKKGEIEFRLEGASGTYKVRFEKEGYSAFEADLVVNAGDRQEFTAELLDAAVGRRQDATRAFNAGAEAFNAGDLETAVAKFQEAADADPSWNKPQLGLANVYNQQGDWAAAAMAADKYLEQEPGDTQALSTAYVAHRKAGNTERADELLGSLRTTEMAPVLAAQIYNEGIALLQSGEDDAAIEKFEQAMDLNPKLTQAYGTLASLYYNAQRYPEALSLADQLEEIEPGNAQARRVRYLVFDALNDTEQSRAAIDAYFEVDPEGAAGVLYQRADLDFRDGNHALAKNALERILAVMPDMARAHFTLGKIYLSLDEAKAKEHLQRFLELAPEDPEASTAKEMLGYL